MRPPDDVTMANMLSTAEARSGASIGWICSAADNGQVMREQPSCPQDEWVARFAMRFHELQPLTSTAQADDVGTAAFASSGDLEPEVAAEVFSEIVDASVPLNDMNRLLP
jgi:hypothetical protein